MARVSSTSRLYYVGMTLSQVSFSSSWHMKTIAIRGPKGESIAVPSTCLYDCMAIKLEKLVSSGNFQESNVQVMGLIELITGKSFVNQDVDCLA